MNIFSRMNKRKKHQNSSLTQGQERLTFIKMKLKKNDEKLQTLLGDYKNLYDSFLNTENKLFESEKNYDELAKKHQETQDKLEATEEGEVIEKLLKNEAYAFLLAEGLIDKFLEFRENFHRTKAQEVLYNLVTEASLGGLWIDI